MRIATINPDLGPSQTVTQVFRPRGAGRWEDGGTNDNIQGFLRRARVEEDEDHLLQCTYVHQRELNKIM